MQSLSPLALLTIIRNFSFIIKDETDSTMDIGQFLASNAVLIAIISICFVWLVLSVLFFVCFKAFEHSDANGGYSIAEVCEDKEASLNFFVTLIVPLLIDDVHTIQGAATFIIIVVLMCVLLYKTNLYYANPILAVLGYKIYKFKFASNNCYGNEECICITRDDLRSGNSVKYKEIQDRVFCVRV